MNILVGTTNDASVIPIGTHIRVKFCTHMAATCRYLQI